MWVEFNPMRGAYLDCGMRLGIYLINRISLVCECKWYTFNETLRDEDQRRDRRRLFVATKHHIILHEYRVHFTSFSLMTTYIQFEWTDAYADATTNSNTNSDDDAYTITPYTQPATL